MRALFNREEDVLREKTRDVKEVGIAPSRDAETSFKDSGPQSEQSMLSETQGSLASPAGVRSMSSSDRTLSSGMSTGGRASFTPGFQNAADEPVSTPWTPQNLDVVDRGLLSMASATQLFDTYVNDLVQHFPVVVFPDGYSAEELRRTKPTLFLALIAAAAAKSNPHLSSVLNTEVLQAYATRIFINSEKSLELVQSIIVTAVWYYPPDDSGHFKFYEYIHMAATMALDIGIGTKPKISQTRIHHSRHDPEANPEDPPMTSSSMLLRSPSAEADSSDIESRRTFLACYLICSGVSLSMRRPNMLRFNSWMNECVEFLETSLSSAQSDKHVVAWVKLLSIIEEIGTSFSFDDPGGVVSLSESRIQLMLKGFEKRLGAWNRDVGSDVMNGSLAIMFHNSNIYLHEIAMHGDHPPEDFKAPYQVEKIRSTKTGKKATPPYIDAITVCISSAHSLLDIFLGMDVESLRTLPVFNYARLSYAVFVLTKLYISASDPMSDLGEFLDRESLKVGFYSNSVIDHLRMVVGPMKCKVPNMFLGLLVKLQARHKYQEMRLDLEDKADESIEPVVPFGVQKHQHPSSRAAARALNSSDGQPASSGALPAEFNNQNVRTVPTAQLSQTGPSIVGTGPQTSLLHSNHEHKSIGSAPDLTPTGITSTTDGTDQYTMQFGPDNDFQSVSSALLGHQMDLDTDLFSLFNDIGVFAGDNNYWTPSAGISGDISNEQMPELYDWSFER